MSLRQNNIPDGIVRTSTNVIPNIWTHVAITFDNSLVKFYLNGLFESQGNLPNTSFNITSDGIKIGQREYDGQDDDFIGFLDDIRIYSDVLSETEITAIYEEYLSNKTIHNYSGKKSEVVFFPNPTSGNIVIHMGSNFPFNKYKLEVEDFYGQNVFVSSISGEKDFFFGC